MASAWVGPRAALERSKRGEIELALATRGSLTELSAFVRAAEAFEFARTRTDIEAEQACWASGRDGKKLFRRSDAPYAEIHWSDPEEAGDTSYDMIPGVAKRLDRWVTRIIAPNPSVMTGPGTNTYLVGADELAGIDPGPDLPEHVAAILEAVLGARIQVSDPE